MGLYSWLPGDSYGDSYGQPTDGTIAPDPIGQLFGVNIGATVDDVQAVGKAAGWQCGLTGDAVVCLARGTPATHTTYWLRDGSVGRVYRLAQVEGRDFALFNRAYESFQQSARNVLRREPDETQTLPSWFLGASEARYASFVKFNLARSATWKLDTARLSVSLRSEQGRPVVVVSVESTQDCSSKVLSAALLYLHPPASPERRSKSAQIVATCTGRRGAGALAAALVQDPEPSVRAEMVRSLARVPSPVATQALARAAREDRSPEIQKQSLRALVHLNAGDEAKAIAADKHQPAKLRRLASEVLAEAKAPAPEDAILSVEPIAVAPAPATLALRAAP
ncbi:MAG TPA: HEAT repeat domain-containing protein, partial [Polyangia bacterium]